MYHNRTSLLFGAGLNILGDFSGTKNNKKSVIYYIHFSPIINRRPLKDTVKI